MTSSDPIHEPAHACQAVEEVITGSMLDINRNVRQPVSMQTNVRTFLRDFAAIKARAQKGETIHVLDKEGEFLFTSATRRKSLLGSAKGRVLSLGDLTQPTLQEGDLKPSL